LPHLPHSADAPESVQIHADKNNQYLTCQAEGNPPVTFIWILPDESRKDGPTVDLKGADDPARANDTYSCIVQNSMGTKSRNITVAEATKLVTSKYITSSVFF